MNETYVYSYFDVDRGWDDTNPKWYTVSINNSTLDKHVAMVKWIYDNIDKPERHCRWIIYEFTISAFRFRYERDYILFRLTWE